MLLIKEPLYCYNDVTIIPSIVSNIAHRDDCKPYDDNGMLPIFTAPMSSVVGSDNYDIFRKNKIYSIIPRTEDLDVRMKIVENGGWAAFSLCEFRDVFISKGRKLDCMIHVVIDIANGHMANLYRTVSEAKLIYGDQMIIMTGNIANWDTYELACQAGVDYIRCGIGSGNGCLTSSNTAIHAPMASLISNVFEKKVSLNGKYKKFPYIVADGGIRNYCDVIKALALGADYVMIGSVLSALRDSSAKMKIVDGNEYKVFYGMASKMGQNDLYGKKIKTSEGKTKYLPVMGTIAQWSENMTDYLKSAMSYTGIYSLSGFKNVTVGVMTENAKESINK